ncbi:MAG: hypothetical protein QW041_00135 [Candidatus Pacearchaeota archaeon]
MKKLIAIIIIILLIVGIFIVVSNNFNLTKKSDSSEFIRVYSGWISKVTANIVKIVGYAIKMDWLPK